MSRAIRRVALIVETSLAYGRGILSGVSKYMADHGPWEIYVDERSLNDPPPTWPDRWRCDGVIMRAQNKSTAEMVAAMGVPAVDTLHELYDLDVPAVLSDSEGVAQLIVEHLLARHFRNFAYVGVDGALWSDMRRNAVLQALALAGHDCHVFSGGTGCHSAGPAQDQQQLAAWLGKLPKPVAVVTPYDLRARAVLDACRWQNLAVPDEVSVIGVGNDEALCTLVDPPLSSVKLNFELLGYEAAALLTRLMDGAPPPASPILIKPLGVVTRRSTEVIAVDDALTAQALRYIQEHACQGIKVGDVAEHCGASRRTIEQNFERILGMSPHKYILRLRVARVKEMLLQTDFPLEVIAERSGFANAPYLNVLFKRYVGQTPGEFRRHAVSGREQDARG